MPLCLVMLSCRVVMSHYDVTLSICTFMSHCNCRTISSRCHTVMSHYHVTLSSCTVMSHCNCHTISSCCHTVIPHCNCRTITSHCHAILARHSVTLRYPYLRRKTSGFSISHSSYVSVSILFLSRINSMSAVLSSASSSALRLSTDSRLSLLMDS